MGVRALMAALRGSEEPDPGPDAVSGPTEERGRLERRVRGPRSGEGGAATLLREGEVERLQPGMRQRRRPLVAETPDVLGSSHPAECPG